MAGFGGDRDEPLGSTKGGKILVGWTMIGFTPVAYPDLRIRIRHCFKQNIQYRESGSAYLRTDWQTKCTMCLMVTLYWGYLIVLWLFHLVCILYCGCFNWFCNAWVCVCVYVGMFCNGCVCVCVGFVICGCLGNMCTCIYCVLYSLYCDLVLFRLCIFILICFVCTGVRTTATEWQLNCS
jgi:hypothetical protein